MKVKQAQKLRNILMIAGTAIMLAAYIYEPLFIIGAVVAFSCLIPHFLFNKCPHCGKQLGNNEAAYCQHCGKRIA
ncbi:MAG: zinc-ribbon domain-containing protein [Oscillospiraceae bacterium]|nr:zinc-ribbon domain-containing protein [Oscillospiraceae bacterium]